MKTLIVGLGSIALKHIEALRIIEPNIKLYALRSSINAKEVEGVINIFDTNELLDHDFDFGLICNPTSEHEKSIELLSKLSLPLFIEKPLYHNLSIENLVINISKKNIITYIGCNLRFLAALQFIKEYLGSKEVRINEINIYCGSFLPEWRPNLNFRQNYSAIPELGGGVHLDLIHELDYLVWLFGMPKCTNKFTSSKSTLNIDAVDYVNYCFEYPKFSANVVLNYFRRDSKRTCEIVTEEDTIIIDLIKNSVISSKDGILFSSNQKTPEMYLRQMEYFIKCIQEGENTFNTISDGYKTLKLALE